MRTWANFSKAIVGSLLCIGSAAWANAPVADAESVDNTLSADNFNMAPANPPGLAEAVVPNTQPQQAAAPQIPRDLPSKSLNVSADANTSVLLLNRIDDLEKEIQSLRGQLEVQDHKITELEGKVKQGGEQVAQAKPVDKTPLKFPKYFNQPVQAAKTQAKVNDEQSYMQAYELIKRKEFPKAITSLKGFIQSYPQSGYLANAYYWLGELYLAQGDLNQSLNAFDTVVRDFPLSNKVAGATLKKGFVFYEKGNMEQAKQQLMEVRAKYPDTSLSRLAAAKLGELNRKTVN